VVCVRAIKKSVCDVVMELRYRASCVVSVALDTEGFVESCLQEFVVWECGVAEVVGGQ
jgi:hypothetical protein